MKKEVVIYFTGKIIPALVNLVIIVLGVRFLGEAEYGRYSLVFYATMLVSTLSFGWIQQSIIRFLSSYKDDLQVALNRFFQLMIASSLAGTLIMFLISLFYFHLDLTGMAFVLFYTFMYNVMMFHLTINQARMKSLNYAILEGSFYLVLLAVLLVFMYVFGTRQYVILFISMSAGLIFVEFIRIIILPGAGYGLDMKKIHWDSHFTRKVMDYGLTITVWLFLSYLMHIADRYIIKEYDSYSAVGAYSAIKDLIFKISTFATMPLLLAYSPRIMDCWNNAQQRKALSLTREALLLELVIFAVALIAFMASRDFLYSKLLHLHESGLFLTSLMLIFSAFLWQAALLTHKPLELLLKQRYMIVAILVCIAVNITANLLFVPHFGFRAAAVASLASSLLYIVFALWMSFYFLNRHRKNNIAVTAF